MTKKPKGRFCIVCSSEIIVDGVAVKTGGWKYCSQDCMNKPRGIKTKPSKLPKKRFSGDVMVCQKKSNKIRVAKYYYDDSAKWEAWDNGKKV